MQKLLTVVIPAYNTENFLEPCLYSLLQTEHRQETEIIVVDDGSTDSTGNIADRVAQKYPEIITVIHKENGGHGSAINVGIQRAKGLYFKVLDSDDWFHVEAYDAFLETLKMITCDLIATPFFCIEAGKSKKRDIEGAEKVKWNTELVLEDVAKQLHIRMHEWTIRTELLQTYKIQLTEHSFYVDMQFILYPIPWIKTVYFLQLPVYCYRLGREGQSVSIKNMQKNQAEHQNVLKSLVAFYQERKQAGDSEAILHYIAKGIAKMQANQMQIFLSMPMKKKTKEALVQSERWLKKECPIAYRLNEKKSIWLLRKSSYVLYPFAVLAWRVGGKK